VYWKSLIPKIAKRKSLVKNLSATLALAKTAIVWPPVATLRTFVFTIPATGKSSPLDLLTNVSMLFNSQRMLQLLLLLISLVMSIGKKPYKE
jgi:hypothetical protein